MAPVLGSVKDVVDGVDARREEAEGSGREGDASRHVIVSKRARSSCRGDQQLVLDPLLRSHRRHRCAYGAAPRFAQGQSARVGGFHRTTLRALSQEAYEINEEPHSNEGPLRITSG